MRVMWLSRDVGSALAACRTSFFSVSQTVVILVDIAQRVTYRRRNPYNTRSNKIKVVKTPGGKLVAQHVKKQASRPKCGDCGDALQGISTLRPRQYAQVSKTHKTVQRAYGGSRCANCVKERVVRAFLIEEQKIVKRVLKDQQAKEAGKARKWRGGVYTYDLVNNKSKWEVVEALLKWMIIRCKTISSLLIFQKSLERLFGGFVSFFYPFFGPVALHLGKVYEMVNIAKIWVV